MENEQRGQCVPGASRGQALFVVAACDQWQEEEGQIVDSIDQVLDQVLSWGHDASRVFLAIVDLHDQSVVEVCEPTIVLLLVSPRSAESLEHGLQVFVFVEIWMVVRPRQDVEEIEH